MVMKKIKISKTSIIIIVLAVVALAGIGFGTFAFFTASATSERNEITSGNLSMNANGGNENFRFDLSSATLQPGDYITSGQNDSATIEIENTGNLEMIYMSNFRYADGKNENFFSNGLVFESLERSIVGPNDVVIEDIVYIEDYELDASLSGFADDIDKYNINGEDSSTPGVESDDLISIREWIEFCETKDAAMEGIYAGKLGEGYKDVWTLKIKFHESCGNRYNIKNGFNLFLDYSAEATQSTEEAVVEFLGSQTVIPLDFDNTTGDFDDVAEEWISEL